MAVLVATSLTAGLLTVLFATFSLILALIRAHTGIHYGMGGGPGKKDLTNLVRYDLRTQSSLGLTSAG